MQTYLIILLLALMLAGTTSADPAIIRPTKPSLRAHNSKAHAPKPKPNYDDAMVMSNDRELGNVGDKKKNDGGKKKVKNDNDNEKDKNEKDKKKDKDKKKKDKKKDDPTAAPMAGPTYEPTTVPSKVPSPLPTAAPLVITDSPSATPTISAAPTTLETATPTAVPTIAPSHLPTTLTPAPSHSPTAEPVVTTTAMPTAAPSHAPTAIAAAPTSSNVQVENWSTQSAGPSLTVNVGDTVEWTWTGNHNVWSMNSNNCDDTITEVGDTSGTTVTFDTTGTYWFSCQVGNGNHCEQQDMLMSVTVVQPV